MTGTIINTAAIVAGGIAGLTLAKHLTPARKVWLKMFLGALVIYAGGSTIWRALTNHTFGESAKLIGIALLALVLGNVVGVLLRLQRGLNRLGEYAKERFASTRPGDPNRFSEGFVTCTILFCVGPMAILGSIQDGLTGDFRTLAIKSAMDGLATMGFIGTFGWGVILAAVPVLAYQGTITLLARSIQPWLEQHAMVDAINASGGLIVLCTAVVVLGVRKVPLANYLPALVVAPLLANWWMG